MSLFHDECRFNVSRHPYLDNKIKLISVYIYTDTNTVNVDAIDKNGKRKLLFMSKRMNNIFKILNTHHAIKVQTDNWEFDWNFYNYIFNENKITH